LVGVADLASSFGGSMAVWVSLDMVIIAMTLVTVLSFSVRVRVVEALVDREI
jgi:hypothetical protein